MRALEILAFGPLSAPQLALALQSHPRTVRRLLARLEEEGYLTISQDGRRRYELTMRLVALAGQVVENSTLARRARPYVTALHERTGLTAHLAVPSYRSVLCLVHQAPEMTDVRPQLRELVPAHCTAGGKVLLAFRERWRDSVLADRALERQTDRTVVDPAALRRELDVTRDRGYATEDGEFQLGVRAVAAPVFIDGDPAAALAASGRELDLDRSAAAVVAFAGQLGEDLSGPAQ
ncbi:MAG: IclR family transcriptional regulator, regulon repressor [Solirubrobacteraceae bacterium]